MTAACTGVVLLYRWRLRSGSEAQFVADWSTITQRLRDERGSLGSRLHRGDDGTWYAYAQWPDPDSMTKALADPLDVAASVRMGEAILERFAPVKLQPVADYLVSSGCRCE